jgi:hypothetical protein
VLELRREFEMRVRLVRSLEWPRGLSFTFFSPASAHERQGSPRWPDRTLGLSRPEPSNRRIRLGDLERQRQTAALHRAPSKVNDTHNRWGYAGDDVRTG